MIHALAILKKAAAIVNVEYGLEQTLADVIVKAADEVCWRTFTKVTDLLVNGVTSIVA